METGEAIKFQLRENPSTGFTWEIEDQDDLRVSDTYKSGPARKPGLLGQTKNLLGSSGVRIFTVYSSRHPK